ncbi:DnaJ-domain-containing protein [Violaceomyces palustris]|uniref:DnaJ-domain-containing protein n=1 Tax=Violaceomyces palustris TaxID=1673888 RepID=A0ACD0P0W6_9BASI|nr:DnaJ-domain-containing protein [Violaceomyces palustris]
MEAPLPDYYQTLGVLPTASSAEIKEAYKKKSLATHPDRFPNASTQERQRYTQRFQTLADAYYVLSDPDRRAEYDQIKSSRPSSSFFDYSSEQDTEKEQGASASFFSHFFSSPDSEPSEAGTESEGLPRGQPQANGIFADVFEELLRPEVHRVAPIWKWIGSASGGALGFIVGNIPGAIGGAVVGSQLGAIRDAKGKSVAEVFINLGASQRAEVLTRLFQKIVTQQ